MKTFIAIFLTLFMMLLFQFAQAAEKTPSPSQYVNMVVMEDVGIIEGKGNSKAQAFAAAADDCYNKKLASLKGDKSEEALLDIIDQCANIPY